MKKELLVLVAGMFMAAGAWGQNVNMTPTNWKFDNMAKGSADHLFVKEGAAIGGNFVGKVLENGHKGYRYADNLQGGFTVAHWTGANDGTSYSAMTEAQKADFEIFYKSFQIVDGGKLGNVMIYQGNSSTEKDDRAVKNPLAMVAPNVYLVSQKDLPVGLYKLSVPMRIILNQGVDPSKIDVYVGDSWWNGVPLAGSTSTDYAHFSFDAVTDFNEFWTNYQFEIEVKPNSDPIFDFGPLLVKLGLGGLANNAIMIFDDLKIEKISKAELKGELLAEPVEWSDKPTGITTTKYKSDDVIVFANKNGIQVIDATEAIEVYASSGQLVNRVMPTGTVTTLPLTSKGVYVVKTGTTTHKVVY